MEGFASLLGLSGSRLGGSWAAFGRSWASLGRLVEPSWALLVASGLSWLPPGSILEGFVCLQARFSRVLGASDPRFPEVCGLCWQSLLQAGLLTSPEALSQYLVIS